MKYLWLVSALLIAGSVFAAGNREEAGTDASGNVDLNFTVWSGFDGHLSMLDEIAADYHDQHPNISVSFSTIPFGDYVSKVTVQLAGSDPVDSGWIVETSAPAFVEAGALLDIRAAVDQYDFDDFSQPALGLWTRGEHLYGVPFSTSPFIILYNQDLFDGAGVPNPDELVAAGEWTWERFAEVSKSVRDATGTFGFQTIDGQGFDVRVWHTLIPIMRAYGADAWDAGGNCGFADAEAIEAVQLFHDMVYVDRSVVPPGDQSDFFAGNAAMTLGQISRVGKLADADFAWGIAPLPSGPYGSAPVIGQAAVVAFAAGENPEAAADFVAFMTNQQNVERMAEYFPPARMSVLESQTFLESNPMVTPEDMAVIADAIRMGEVLPNHENFQRITLATRSEFDALWTADADVGAVLRRVCDAITPLIQ